MPKKHIDTINPKHLIVVRPKKQGQQARYAPHWTVKAHLPEQFGFSVGSEIGTPFAGFASDGNVAKFMALYYGASAKVGVITKKAYMGPEPTEMSLSLQFDAYYSGFEEVMIPCATLMGLSIGEDKEIAEALQRWASNLSWNPSRAAGEYLAGKASEDTEQKISTISDYIRYMRSPGLVNIRFGNVFHIKNAFLASVEPQFSNVLDNEGHPISATCSVNVQLQMPMTKVRLSEAFGMPQLSLEEDDGG